MKLGSARCPFLAATSISVSFNIGGPTQTRQLSGGFCSAQVDGRRDQGIHVTIMLMWPFQIVIQCVFVSPFSLAEGLPGENARIGHSNTWPVQGSGVVPARNQCLEISFLINYGGAVA